MSRFFPIINPWVLLLTYKHGYTEAISSTEHSSTLQLCSWYFQIWYQHIMIRKTNDENYSREHIHDTTGHAHFITIVCGDSTKRNLLGSFSVMDIYIYYLFNTYLLSTFYILYIIVGKSIHEWTKIMVFTFRELKSGGRKSIRS